jgi:DNA-binding PadR family transcriptional regulator
VGHGSGGGRCSWWLLARLRRKGRVADYWVESTSGPPRGYYSPNQAGRAALSEFSANLRNFSAAVDAVVVPGDAVTRT